MNPRRTAVSFAARELMISIIIRMERAKIVGTNLACDNRVKVVISAWAPMKTKMIYKPLTILVIFVLSCNRNYRGSKIAASFDVDTMDRTL